MSTTHLSSVLQNTAVIIWALMQQNKSTVWKCKTDVTQHIRDVTSSLWNSPVQGVDYKENRKKEAYAEARPANHSP